MDCKSLALAVVFGCVTPYSPSSFGTESRLPDEARWLAPNADIVSALTSRPVECLQPAKTLDNKNAQNLGRLAFESPALLGGQPARIGLACASCHRNGRGNTAFFIKGISTQPGTADVSSNLLGSNSDDGVFNPKTIPDLALKKGLTFKKRRTQAFRKKLHQLIEVEFHGIEPPPQIFNALQIYLASLDTTVCKKPSDRKAVTWQYDWQMLLLSVDFIEEALLKKERDLAHFIIRIARLKLQTIYQRFSNIEYSQVGEALIALSRQLAALRDTRKSPAEIHSALQHWHNKSSELPVLFEREKDKSTYNKDNLIRILATG